LYNEAFGGGRFEELNLPRNAENIKKIRDELVEECKANVKSELSNCEKIVTTAIAVTGYVCGAGAHAAGLAGATVTFGLSPVAAFYVAQACGAAAIAGSYYADQMCSSIRVDWTGDCIQEI